MLSKCVSAEREEGSERSPLRCSARCLPASPAGREPTATAPAQSCRCTGPEGHTAGREEGKKSETRAVATNEGGGHNKKKKKP